MNGPISPAELDRVRAYWSGGQTSDPNAPAPPPPPQEQPIGPPGPAPVTFNAQPSLLPNVNIPAGPPPDITAGLGPPPAPPPQAPIGPPPPPPATQSAPFLPPTAKPGQSTGGLVRSPTVSRAVPGAGGPGNPDPFGLKGAQKALLSSYDTQKGGQGREGAAEAAKAERISELGGQYAREQMEDAAIERATQEHQQRTLNEGLSRVSDQMEALKEQKIDPGRLFPDAGSKMFAVVGGILGGLYQGMNRQATNPFLDQMNKMIDRDIAVQERNINNERAAVGDQFNLFGQLRSTFKDDQIARLQARNLYYEGAKQQIASEASHYDSGIVQSRADQAISLIDRQQKTLQVQIAQSLQAQAAAAAAQRRASLKFDMEQEKLRAETGHLWAQAEKLRADAAGGSPEALQSLRHMSDQLVKLNNPDLERLANYIRTGEGKYDETREIPGTGRLANLRESLAPPIGAGGALDVLGALGPAPVAARLGSAWLGGLSPEERNNHNALKRLSLAFRHETTGVAGADKELREIADAFDGAQTTGEIARAVASADQKLQNAIRLTKAADPRAAAKLEANIKQQIASDKAPPTLENP